jgi:hypothetical protein
MLTAVVPLLDGRRGGIGTEIGTDARSLSCGEAIGRGDTTTSLFGAGASNPRRSMRGRTVAVDDEYGDDDCWFLAPDVLAVFALTFRA